MLVGFSAAAADYVQWQFNADWDTSVKFATEAEAADKMRAGTHAQDPYLTERGEVYQMGRDYYRRRWTVKPVDPIEEEWEYYSCGSGVTRQATPAEAIALCLAEVQEGGQCAPLAQLAGEGEWQVTSSFYIYPRNMAKTYYIQTWGYGLNPEPHCFEHENPSGFPLYAERYVGCPGGYSWSSAIQKCATSHTGYTEGKPVTGCGEEVGNPCNTASGAKLVREVDYSGPGIEFMRAFNSQAELGWSHNFSGYVALSGTTSIHGAIAWDGYQTPMKSVTGGWISYMGSGLEARKVGSEWVLYYPSGAKDYWS